MPGITIVYSAVAGSGVTNSVPALGTMATAGLSMLAAAAGAWGLRGRGTGQRMLAVGVCSGALVALLCSGLGASAWAAVRDSFNSASGGVLTYDDTVNVADTWAGLNNPPSHSFNLCQSKTTGALTNTTGVNLNIDTVSMTQVQPNISIYDTDADFTVAYTGSSAPRCTPGTTTLQPGQSCQVILVSSTC